LLVHVSSGPFFQISQKSLHGREVALVLLYSVIYQVKHFRNQNRCGRGLIVSVGSWLDGCGLLLGDVLWVTGCPALVIREEMF